MNRFYCRIYRIVIGVFIAGFIFSLIGCGSPYTVQRSSMKRFFKKKQQSALISDKPSELTQQYLRLRNLDQLYLKDRQEFFSQFTGYIRVNRTLDSARVMAELSMLEGRKYASQNKPAKAKASYLTAAEASYRYLLSGELRTTDETLNPGYRFVAQIYNAAVGEVVEILDSRQENWPRQGTYQTVHTVYEFTLAPPSHEVWNPDLFDELISAYDIKTKGLRNTYFNPGLGAALIGVVSDPSGSLKWGKFFAAQKTAYPVTAMLIFDAPRIEGDQRHVNVQVVLYNPLTLDQVMIEDQSIPLEVDYSTPLVIQLQNINPMKLGLSSMFQSDKKIDQADLFLLEQYNPEKIPVLMVHGLMDSPIGWVEMFNDLRGHPEIRENYQFWFFSYPTGLPVLYSSSILRQKLMEVQAELDPDKSNPNFNNMVLIGHSMGGLLSRVMMQDSGSIYYDNFFSVPMDQLSIDETSRDLLKQVLLFESVPFIKRVVFMAAPHRGSPLADKWFANFANDLIGLPDNISDTTQSVLSDEAALNQEIFKKTKKIRFQSIGNLSTKSPFCEAYNKVPVRQDVKYHSIIGIRDAKAGPGSSDGVVPYESSHVDFVSSECLIPSDHFAPDHADGIDEVKRILLMHLEKSN